MVVTERNPERDKESGQFDAHYSDQDFLDAVQDSNGGGTTEVAETVGCDRRTAYLRLKQLEEAGKVTSREVGNAFLWTVKEDADAE